MDLHRLLALKGKNNEIYLKDKGLIARYGGYVPGGKFRHSDTFARLTQDAKGIRIILLIIAVFAI